MIKTLKCKEINLEVTYVHESERSVMYNTDGGGYPGYDNIEIEKIEHNGEDIHELLSNDIIEDIIDNIKNN